MKYFFICLSIFSFCFEKTYSQSPDSLMVGYKNDSIIQYLSPLEYAFMMHEETKFMLRVPAWGVGAELEILPYFTWMTQIHTPFLVRDADGIWILDINSELRYYYGSRKLGVRNMSGNYIGAGVKNGELYSLRNPGYYVRWGMQRRILGSGLADIGIIAGFNTQRSASSPEYGFFVKSPVTLGFGFVFGKRATMDRDRLCPVVKCHEIERFLLKINFSNLVDIDFISNPGRQNHLFAFQPQVAAEKKIFDLPLSLNFDVRGIIRHWNIRVSDVYYQSASAFSLNWNAGCRYYYNMGRRMRLGKGGNGLSGNYLAAGVGSQNYTLRSQINESEIQNISNWNSKILPFFSTGIQRTLGKNLYFDIEVGTRQEVYDTFSGQEVENFKLGLFGGAQIGIKF